MSPPACAHYQHYSSHISFGPRRAAAAGKGCKMQSNGPGQGTSRLPMLTCRFTLRGIQIPEVPPPASKWKLSDGLKEKLPAYFGNAIDSISNAGTEFTYYCRRYQFQYHTEYTTMTGLLASWEILAQNVPALLEGLQQLRPDEIQGAGGPEGVQEISTQVQHMAGLVEPYRLAMSVLAGQGVMGVEREDPGQE